MDPDFEMPHKSALYSGYDERYNATIDDSIILADITRIFYETEILQKLESPHISEPNKLEIINKHNKLKQGSSITAPNIKNGGLFSDWGKDISTGL